MLDCIELVFNRLKEFNLKVKPKKCHFFDTSVLFLGHVLSSEGISANPKKVGKIRDWPIPTNTKEVNSFLGLASYFRGSFQSLQRLPSVYMSWLVQHPTNIKKQEVRRVENWLHPMKLPKQDNLNGCLNTNKHLMH